MPKIHKNFISTSINDSEIEKFSRLAEHWWDPKGKFRPLHKFNPTRISYILDMIAQHNGISLNSELPLQGVKILDIGCGGGLLCEPLARLGASVVGIDAAEKNIAVAKLHAEKMGLAIDYRAISLEELSEDGAAFDIVLNMEVVEHVDNLANFMLCCCKTVKPGGMVFVATLNRSFKAWAFAIIAAEYILRWLPRGTHDFTRFITPDELKAYFHKDEFALVAQTGIVYNPLRDSWDLSKDMSVNYMIVTKKLT